MATNALKTLNDGDITREALRILKNENSIIGAVNRQYDDRFAQTGAKNGGTLQIRLPNRYSVTTGRTMTAGGGDTNELTTSLVVATQKHVSVGFFSSELTLSLDDFSSRIIRPAVSVLASTIANDVALAASQGFTNFVGTPGTTPSSFLTYAQAGERLDWQTAPRDGNRSIVLNPTAMAATADAQKGLFAPSGAIGDQYESGMIEKMTGFRFLMDQSLATISHGSGSGYQTNTPTFTSGSSVLAVDTGTGALTAGQQFTIAGVFEVNPDTKASTGILKVFTVNTNYAGGAGNIALSQPIYTSGPYQNVSAAPPDNTALTLVGAASTAFVRNLAFHRDAVVLAMADLEVPRGTDMANRQSMDGLSIRFIRDYDTTNDNWIGRFDVLYGIKVVRPEWGCVVYG